MTSRQKSNSRPGATRGARAASTARRAVESTNRDAIRKNKVVAAELAKIQSQYKRDLVKLIGREGAHELNLIRRGNAGRSRRIKQSLAQLDRIGVDRAKILEVRLPYLARGRDVLGDLTNIVPYDSPYPSCDNPWVTYRAPFSGYSWAWSWERTSNPSNPVLSRYLDTQTGAIGSSIDVKDDDAGDDDFLSADYYTGLSVWHTPLSTGVLEVYLVFEFNNATYSGKIRDEFGFSDILYTQAGVPKILAADAFDPVQRETVQSYMYGFTEFMWSGEDESWNRIVASPRDRHWYFFRTGATFQQGSSVMIEGGIHQSAWFQANDDAISMSADLNLRLDAIMVRSCDAPIIL